ncbi:MAG: hypothetical protein EU541_08735 [Promethearchaeota archaeon]|nr:MAG: hypothetical protein EU541_08735 [Candidatus Lokiarchaeota archaeon]
MSEMERQNEIIIDITQFPHHLLLPSTNNIIKLRITNNSDKQKNLKLEASGQNLDVRLISLTEKTFSIPPKDNQVIEIGLVPKANGNGIIAINIEWFKKVQFTVKVQKIREHVPKKKLDKILNTYKFSSNLQIEPIKADKFSLELSNSEIKKLTKNISRIKEELKLKSSEEAIKTVELYKELDVCQKTLVKGCINNKEFDEALSIIKTFPNEENKKDFLRNVIRANFFIDFETMLQAIELIENIPDKQKLLETVFLDLMERKTDNALVLLEHIKQDNDFYVKALFHIARNYLKNNQIEKTESLLIKIVNLAIQNGIEKYNLLKDVIYTFAEIISPKKADEMIHLIKDHPLKEKVTKDLFDDIYIMADELREKIESELIGSYNYSINISIEEGNNITKFANTGGNISSNILEGQFNFESLLVSLFSHEFSLFPTIEHLYTDLANNSEKSLGYVIFPSQKSLKDDEKTVISTVLKKLVVNKSQANNMMLFNIDFIPYLGKPTLIIGADQRIGIQLKEKLQSFNQSVNISVNNDLFEGGKTIDYINNIFAGKRITPINLVFSYEFINQYDLFRDIFINII